MEAKIPELGQFKTIVDVQGITANGIEQGGKAIIGTDHPIRKRKDGTLFPFRGAGDQDSSTDARVLPREVPTALDEGVRRIEGREGITVIDQGTEYEVIRIKMHAKIYWVLVGKGEGQQFIVADDKDDPMHDDKQYLYGMERSQGGTVDCASYERRATEVLEGIKGDIDKLDLADCLLQREALENALAGFGHDTGTMTGGCESLGEEFKYAKEAGVVLRIQLDYSDFRIIESEEERWVSSFEAIFLRLLYNYIAAKVDEGLKGKSFTDILASQEVDFDLGNEWDDDIKIGYYSRHVVMHGGKLHLLSVGIDTMDFAPIIGLKAVEAPEYPRASSPFYGYKFPMMKFEKGDDGKWVLTINVLLDHRVDEDRKTVINPRKQIDKVWAGQSLAVRRSKGLGHHPELDARGRWAALKQNCLHGS